MTLIEDIARQTEPDEETCAGMRSAAGDMAGFAEAVVDLAAIAHNTAVLTEAARGGVMAVVKANGFGHGAVPVSRTALDAGASWLGVTSIAEGLELRAADISAPLLAWMHLPADDLAPVVRHAIDL